MRFRGNKYGARRTPCHHGHMHASVIESRRCDELTLMERAGEIRNLRQQPSWKLMVYGVLIGDYTADFRYEDRRGGWKSIVEDVKGGPVSRDVPLRLKLMKALYGIDGGVWFCRRSDFQEIGGYNETVPLGEDVDFLRRLKRLGAGRRPKLPAPRRRPCSVSNVRPAASRSSGQRTR